VAIVTVEPVDLTLNPIVVPGTGNGTATIPVGATNHILIELGATFANAHVNGSLSLPGGLTVQYQGDTDSQGRIQFTIVVTDPHVSINGSIPIPVNYGQNTVLAAEEVGGKSIVQVLTVTIPNSSGTTTVPSGAPATGVASGSSSANVALVVGGAALVVVAAGLAITAARRRSSAQ